MYVIQMNLVIEKYHLNKSMLPILRHMHINIPLLYIVATDKKNGQLIAVSCINSKDGGHLNYYEIFIF